MSLASQLESLESPHLDAGAIADWNQLLGQETRQQRTYRALLESAQTHLAGYADATCPLCGQSVSIDALRAQVSKTLEELLVQSRRFHDTAGAGRAIDSIRSV
jgi:hypothetical protein